MSDGCWLAADEAAVYLRLPSRQALYMAVRRGQIPARRFGRRLRFERGELDRALAGKEPLLVARPARRIGA